MLFPSTTTTATAATEEGPSPEAKAVTTSAARSQGNRPRRQLAGVELTIDHVVPRAQGGESSWTNCVLACLECNKRKADRTPAQAKMRLRKEPVRPTWKPVYSEHASRMECWSKFVSEAYWNAELRS